MGEGALSHIVNVISEWALGILTPLIPKITFAIGNHSHLAFAELFVFPHFQHNLPFPNL